MPAARFGRPLLRSGGVALVLIALLGVCAPGQAGAVQGVEEFYAHVAHGKIVTCAVYDGYLDEHEALCEYTSGHSQAKATLRGDGSVVLCRAHSLRSDRCGLGDAGTNAKTHSAGKTVRVGRFACVVQRIAVRCTVAATGKGFLFGPKRLRALGGAPVRHL